MVVFYFGDGLEQHHGELLILHVAFFEKKNEGFLYKLIKLGVIKLFDDSLQQDLDILNVFGLSV